MTDSPQDLTAVRRRRADAYRVSLPHVDFEGPLDLLLHLIERRELPITQIALATIADEYLGRVRSLRDSDPADLSDFVNVGSRLVLIKSQALLPRPPATDDVQATDDADSAAELVAQLRAYKQVKAAALFLRERDSLNVRTYSRSVPPTITSAPGVPTSGLEGLRLADLMKLVEKRLKIAAQMRLPLPADEKEVRAMVRAVKIEDKIAHIAGRLGLALDSHIAREGQQLSLDAAKPEAEVRFSSLFADLANQPPDSISPDRVRLEVTVTFMAVLELLRQRRVTATQDALFGDIIITPVHE